MESILNHFLQILLSRALTAATQGETLAFDKHRMAFPTGMKGLLFFIICESIPPLALKAELNEESARRGESNYAFPLCRVSHGKA